MPINVCHFTSGHDRLDARIFKKQCRTLADADYEVHLVTPVGGNTITNKVNIWGVGASVEGYGRLKRMLLVSWIVYQKALSLDADIYHFHDPELIPYGLRLKKRGKKVIFDCHEDTPSDILEKHWIPIFLRRYVSQIFQKYEEYAVKKFDAVVSVTPHIVDRLKNANSNAHLITNYPLLEDTLPLVISSNVKQNKTFCFVGRISDESMQQNIIEALGRVAGGKYILAGPSDPSFINKLSNIAGWEKCEYYGPIQFAETSKFMSKGVAGLQLTDYIPNFGYKIGSLGNTKLFAYMAAGLPVICTDMILWKNIIEEYSCGICVNPNNVDEISQAMTYILDNPEEARKMGENGRRAVLEKYNWKSQIPNVLKLYQSIL